MKKNLIVILLLFTALSTTGCNSLLINQDVYLIKQNGKVGFIDNRGKEVIDTKYDDAIISKDENLIAVKFNGLWGFIDKNGEFVIIPQFKETKGFQNSLAYVVDDNFEGYIDKNGKYVWKKSKENNKKENQEQKKSSNIQQPQPVKNDLADSIFRELGM